MVNNGDSNGYIINTCNYSDPGVDLKLDHPQKVNGFKY